MNVPFSKPAAEPKRKWLKITKAAELLCVDVRTIKRWMKDAARRQALGVVMHGKQNRIPLPPSLNGDGEFAWEMLTR